MLLGDINTDYLKKDDNKHVKEVFEFYELKKIITKATRITDTSKTLIDCIVTTSLFNISANDVIPTCIGGHDMVGYVRKINNLKFAHKNIRCRNYMRYNHNAMKTVMKEVDWRPLYSITNVNTAWLFIKKVLLNTFNQHAPLIEKRIKGRFCPWLTADIGTPVDK